MFNRAVEKSPPWIRRYVSDQYKTQEMCNEAVKNSPWMLEYVPDQYKLKKCAMKQRNKVLRF